MAISTIVKTKRDGTIAFADAAAAHTLTVAYEQGDLNITIPSYTIVSVLDRGEFTSTPTLRKGDDQPCTFTFTAYLRDLSDASYITLEEIVCNAGYFASTWVSRGGATADVKTVQITWSCEGSNHGDSADHTLVLDYCWITGSLQEGDPDVISISGTAYDLYPTLT